jgi:4-hydroxy-tetrahydrodipicolinate synthase
MAEIRGVITAMVTPFNADESLDLDAARRLAGYLVEQGSHGLVVAGTTGEAPTLSDDEKIVLLEAVLDEVGDRATVICGTGTNDTRHTAALTRRAADAGAHGVLVVTPYYNKPNEAGLRAHFAAVSEGAGETPIVIYNIPSRCVINMSPALLGSLAAEHANVVAVKQANSDEIGPIDGMEVLSGNDDVFARCLELGGVGGILVSSHLAGQAMRALYDAAIGGDHDRARVIDGELQPVYAATAIAPPAVCVKAALEAEGLIGGTLRLPMVPASPEERTQILAALERHRATVREAA